MMKSTRFALAAAALLAGSAPSLADEIHLVDGRVLEDVTVEREALNEVAYEDGGKKQIVPSDQVLAIVFSRMPSLVDEAMAFAVENDLGAALDVLDEYVDGQIEKASERRFRWAPAYAAWMTVELRQAIGDLDGVRASADRLITNFDGSRYLPLAFLARADAELLADDSAAAVATLGKLSELVASKQLSGRWTLECRIGLVRADGTMSGDDKRKELQQIVGEAGDGQPSVAARAALAQGETYLIEAEGAGGAAARELRETAKGIFQAIIADHRGDDETMAGAHSGLGDCLFYLGADSDDASVLREAASHYLRVIALYEREGRYAPRSLFFAMRCFDLMQDARRKSDMKRELASLYPGSHWASEAAKF